MYFISYTGYSYSYDSFFSGGSPNLNAPILLDWIDCDTSDTKLSDCYTYEYGTYIPTCTRVAGVMCEGNGIMHKIVHTI